MTTDPLFDPYAILGVTRAATLKEIKATYRKLAKLQHPDKNPGDAEVAVRFRDITDAWNILSDPLQREDWDRKNPPGPGTGVTTPGDIPAASRLLTVLEDTWRQIRRNHPEIPPVVVIIASGTDGKHPRWGHHAPGRWHHDNAEHAEVMISGEGLRRTPREVLGTLLHEAAHALAAARNITDTSRQGRYHNKKYAKLAVELGLDVTEDPSGQYGWTITTVTDATGQRYGDQLDALAFAMTLWRADEHTPGTTKKRDTNLIAASCPCGRKIRVAASTLKEAPIRCEACDGSFEPDSAS